MKRGWILFTAGLIIGGLVHWGITLRPRQPQDLPPTADLPSAYQQFASALESAGKFVEHHTWYGSEKERAEAYRHIIRILINSLESYALSDPDFPFFQEINPRNKLGMDNSDQRYLVAMIDGDAVYRLRGSRGTSRRLDIAIYGQDTLSPSIATLDTDSIVVDENGDFEIIVGGPPRENNWLASQPGPLRLFIRQIHADWQTETPGQLHIDRIDEARPRYPRFDATVMHERLTAATRAFATEVRRWPELSRTRLALYPANTLTPPLDTGGEGGLPGRVMIGGHFSLDDDQALVITAYPTDAAYQSIQLGHHWWESLDYANRQSSLTREQATLDNDGALRYVISARDNGHPNWLDTEGFKRGVILMRYDGLSSAGLDKALRPVAEVVPLAKLEKLLPAFNPVTPEQRAAVIESRRRHVQRRFGF